MLVDRRLSSSQQCPATAQKAFPPCLGVPLQTVMQRMREAAAKLARSHPTGRFTYSTSPPFWREMRHAPAALARVFGEIWALPQQQRPGQEEWRLVRVYLRAKPRLRRRLGAAERPQGVQSALTSPSRRKGRMEDRLCAVCPKGGSSAAER